MNQEELEQQNPAKPKLNDRFIMNIKDKDFVQYAGLLDLAHQHGLIKLEVEHLQFPSQENNHVAICRAVATSNTGAVFSDIADADPKNVTKMIVPHILRMASTRAKARALRDMCNIGITCMEELGSFDEVVEENKYSNKTNKSSSANRNNGSSKQSPKNTTTPEKNAEQPTASKPDSTHDSQLPQKLSEAQHRAIRSLSNRRGIEEDELNNLSVKTYGAPVDQLTLSNASSFIRTLQQTA
jgi:hypothetical protein